MAKDNSCCKRNNRDSCYLADVRYCTAGTWVNLDNIYILTYNDELDIDHTDYMKCLCKTTCVLGDGVFCFLADGLCRIYGNTVSGVDTCTLDMLHDSRDQNVLTVAYRINLDLFTHEVFVNKDRMLLCDLVDDSDILFHILIADSNTHSLSSKYVGRADKYRISQLVGSFFRLFCCEYGVSLRSRDLAFLKDGIKELSVLCGIYILSRCSKDLNAHLDQCFGQFDGCLSTELNNSSIRFLDIYYILNIFRCQWLEIQLICNIEVCTYSLRVVVDNNGLISLFRKCPCTVYRAEVELNTLSDTDRAGTKYQDLFLIFCLDCFVLCLVIAVYRVVVWCLCRKLCRTGINHLVCCTDAVLFTKIFDLSFCLACQVSNDVVRELHTFCFQKEVFVQFLSLQSLLHLNQDSQFVDEPDVDLCDVVKFLLGNISAECFCDLPDTAVIHDIQLVKELLIGKMGEVVGHQAVYVLLQGTDGFH